jgi:hypothetical protein
MQAALIIIIIILVVGVVVDTYIIYRVYKKNTTALEMYKGAKQIRPQKSSFIISWFLFFMAVSIPQVIIIWFLPIDRDFFNFIWFFLPVMALLMYFLAYPYYTVILHEGKIIGATLWGWMWKRTEIDVNELVSDNVLKPSLGRSLKITIFKSASGKKILTLGLNNLQIKQILDYTT